MLAVGIFAAKEYSYAPAEGSPQRLGDDGSDLGVDAGLFMEHTRGVLFGTQARCQPSIDPTTSLWTRSVMARPTRRHHQLWAMA